MIRRHTAVIAPALAMLLAFASGSARADLIDDAWKRGNDAYQRGDLGAAAATYQQLVEQGVVAPDLFYNLGVVNVRLDRLGRAIWAFERALVVDPTHEDARFNLQRARAIAERRVRDKIEGAEREPAWIRVVTAFPPGTTTWLFLALYAGAFVLLFARRAARSELRPALGASAAVVGTIALLAGLMLAGRGRLDEIPFAVALSDAVDVKEGADESYRTSFKIHAGLKVRVLEHDRDFARVRLPNGLEGWVAAKDVAAL